MRTALTRTLLLLSLAFFLGGCASYDSSLDPGRSVAKFQRFFVVSNLNDNHGLDHLIAETLKARGRVAELGPLTMMPDDTQVVVIYQDRWTWDFGDHLVAMHIAVRDVRSEQAFASVGFNAKVPLHETTPVTVARLIDNLLKK